MKRRQALVLALLPLAVACSQRSPNGPAAGDLGPDDAEISGVLELGTDDVWEPATFVISGDGHDHDVVLTASALDRLRQRGRVTVRSGPATNDRHSHWIRVTVSV